MTTALQAPPMGEDIARSLPHALGPEKSILSSMLKDPERWIGRAQEEGLTREHFYLPGHGLLFQTIRDLNDMGAEIELVSLVQLLHDRAILDHVGGASNVTDIYTYAPNAAHFETHLGIVKDKALLRSTIEVCTESIAEAYDQPEEPPQWLDGVEERILAIRRTTDTHEEGTLKNHLDSIFASMKRTLAGEEDDHTTATGYADLDRYCKGGLRPGEMAVIAARPSMGKTSLMMNIVEQIAIDLEIPTLVFSCEMTARQLTERLLYARARFDASQLHKGFKPSKDNINKLGRIAKEIAAAPLHLDDTPSLQIETLRAKARRRKREDNIGLIAIDYLQLLRSSSKQAANSREREVGEISAGIKALAKELEVPVIVLAQLNRGPEGRTGKSLGVPRLSDLRESGTIEQDADLVGLLYRSAYYAESEEEKDEEAGKAELILAKNRNGETGHVPLTFIDSLMRFETRARD